MIIVYTAILGSSDSLKPAPSGADRCVCITDDAAHVVTPKGWDVHLWPKEKWIEPTARREAWRLRALPHEVFISGYDTVVWADASFTVIDLPRLVRDAQGHAIAGFAHQKRASCYAEGEELIRIGQSEQAAVEDQLRWYRRAGFKPSALTISGLLVRTSAQGVADFNVAWDNEVHQHAGDNTQLSSDYCAWRVGLQVHHLDGHWKANPYAVYDGKDHKRRRQPYR